MRNKTATGLRGDRDAMVLKTGGAVCAGEMAVSND
jgi:hypothetical protein